MRRPHAVWSRRYGCGGASAPYDAASGGGFLLRRGRASCISKSLTNLSSTLSAVAPNCSMTAVEGSNAASADDESNPAAGASTVAGTAIGDGTDIGSVGSATTSGPALIAGLVFGPAATCDGVIRRPTTGVSGASGRAAFAGAALAGAAFLAAGLATAVTRFAVVERVYRNQKY